MRKLHSDIETFNQLSIQKVGSRKYIEHPSFEILLLSYIIIDDNEDREYTPNDVTCVDIANREKIPEEFLDALFDPSVLKLAHNAAFERYAYQEYFGVEMPPEEWQCTAAMCSYAGLSPGLDKASQALKIKHGKLKSGSALIRYFCSPCKPTKVNGGRTRNMPQHDTKKWNEFKEYNVYDVLAEVEIEKALQNIHFPESERRVYELDQKINDQGVYVDLNLVNNAIQLNKELIEAKKREVTAVTGIVNPNSIDQVFSYITDDLGFMDFDNLKKESIKKILKKTDIPIDVRYILEARQYLSNTSNKKYDAILNVISDNGRVKGLFQYYGAVRTGRWAGRMVQLQNLKKPSDENDYILDFLIGLVNDYDTSFLNLMFENVPEVISQLIRPSFCAEEGKTLVVSDFSAIEARVIAWFAGEEWRKEVFSTHGKIYESSAAQMYGIQVSEVTKAQRARGKIAELALGYQGGWKAILKMGGEDIGLTEAEMKELVKVWRVNNVAIVRLWAAMELAAKEAMRNKGSIFNVRWGVSFLYDGEFLRMRLPSGRELLYYSPKLERVETPFGTERQLTFIGTNGVTGKVERVVTYGGKLVENAVQAIARDLLADAMLRVSKMYDIILHVHDEIGIEVYNHLANKALSDIEKIMSTPPSWAGDIIIKGDSYVSKYYKK